MQPGDWALQSFPFSYVYLDGKAIDGKPHSIQLYSDISGGALVPGTFVIIITQVVPVEWVTNLAGTGIKWSTSQTSNSVYHQVESTTPTSVFEDVAEDSFAYYAISSVRTFEASQIHA
jgi:hypothetical protein